MPPIRKTAAVHGSIARAGVVAATVARQMTPAAASAVNVFRMKRSKLLRAEYPPTILTGA
jgi:hypothetical protein